MRLFHRDPQHKPGHSVSFLTADLRLEASTCLSKQLGPTGCFTGCCEIRAGLHFHTASQHFEELLLVLQQHKQKTSKLILTATKLKADLQKYQTEFKLPAGCHGCRFECACRQVLHPDELRLEDPPVQPVHNNERKERLQHPWQPTRLNGWNSVCSLLHSLCKHMLNQPN